MRTYTQPVERLLLGPGPSNCHPRVLQAMAGPTMGHLDPQFLRVMDECMELMRMVFGTQNPLTIALPATGGAGMEASLVNFIEPGDRVVLGAAGLFAERLIEIATRAGAEVTAVRAPWGEALDWGQLEAAVAEGRPAKLVGLVHAETSTGVGHALAPLADIAQRHGILSLVDTVASLGGMPINADELGLDIIYSGSQKCLSCPPGLAPLTISERAAEVLRNRPTPVASWYFDLTLLAQYWGGGRVYHHTGPSNMTYALRESLSLLAEEGLEQACARHKANCRALYAGLAALGLPGLPAPHDRLDTLAVVWVPAGVDEARVRAALLANYSMEIAGGLGDFKGKIWRIGLMGYNSTARNVNFCLAALGNELRAQGVAVSVDAALEAAAEVGQA